MKMMVTGGAGFIGSAVVRRAIDRGHSVVNVDALTYAGNLANLAPVEDHPAYDFEQADIADRAAMDRILDHYRPGVVVHLAAESHVDRSIDGPAAFIQTNIVGTYTLLEASRAFWGSLGKDQSFLFHHVSTDEVFGSLSLDPSTRFTEETAYDPRSPYSASKASSDHLVRAWHETYGLPITMSNCSNNYGPYHFPEKLIPVVILSCLAERAIPLYGEGINVRDWLYVDDHADAILKIVSEGEVGRSYNVGGGAELSNRDLVTRICTILDGKCARAGGGSYASLIQQVKDRPGHDLRYAIDFSRIQDELGWRPSVSIDEGLERTVQWYLDHEDWWRPLLARSSEGAT